MCHCFGKREYGENRCGRFSCKPTSRSCALFATSGRFSDLPSLGLNLPIGRTISGFCRMSEAEKGLQQRVLYRTYTCFPLTAPLRETAHRKSAAKIGFFVEMCYLCQPKIYRFFNAFDTTVFTLWI